MERLSLLCVGTVILWLSPQYIFSESSAIDVSIRGIFYNTTTNGGYVTVYRMVNNATEAAADILGVSSASCEMVADGFAEIIFLTSEMASAQIDVDSFTEITVTANDTNGTKACNTISLENLTIIIDVQQDPDMGEGDPSISIKVTSTHDVANVSAMVSTGKGGHKENCISMSQSQSMTIVLTCTNLDADTSYDTSVETMVQLANETYPLKFNILFSTKPKDFPISGLGIVLICTTVFMMVLLAAIGGVRVCVYVLPKYKKRQNRTANLNDQQVASNEGSQQSSCNQYSLTTTGQDLYPLSVSIGLDPEMMKKFLSLTIIANCQLKLMESIGQGEFGVVYKSYLYSDGKKNPKIVAVKTLQGIDFSKSELHSFLVESLRMDQFSHLHVLGLLGVCLDAGPSPYLVLPFMSGGSLLSHLKRRRSELVLPRLSSEKAITKTTTDLTSMCLQIAKGMEYLSGEKFVHRDLAARNCMIDDIGIIKVADFGLAKDVYEKMYFREEKKSEVKLPFKWMALESLQDGVFSEKTDVWSFGVTCWEVFSGGVSPYPGMNPMQLTRLLANGGRLENPDNAACSVEIFELLMFQCWRNSPDDRPAFSNLVKDITTFLTKIAGYLDLDTYYLTVCC